MQNNGIMATAYCRLHQLLSKEGDESAERVDIEI